MFCLLRFVVIFLRISLLVCWMVICGFLGCLRYVDVWAGGLLVVAVGLLFLVCDFGRLVLVWWVYGW